jgi:integrase
MATKRKQRARREKGTGRVYQYPAQSGIWWAQLPERNGKSGPKWRVPDRATGEQELAQKLEELRAGVKVYERADTFGELVMACVEQAVDISPTTRETYHDDARLYVLSQPLAKIRVADLEPADIRTWLAGIIQIVSAQTKKPLSASRVRHAYNRVRVAHAVAFEDRRISWPMPKLKLPRAVEDAEKRALTIVECNTLIDAATNARLAMMYKTLIATGMRGSELIGLLWTMIDWERSEIRLTSQLKRLKTTKRFERLPLKNRNRRTIPLDEALLTDLRWWRERQAEERHRRGAEWQENGLVFPTGKGTPFSLRNLLDDLQRDAQNAKIGKVTVHELRHTAGSLMLQAGKTMTVVSKTLGHSSVGVTERTYAHAYEEDKRDAVASVTQQLRRIGGTE